MQEKIKGEETEQNRRQFKKTKTFLSLRGESNTLVSFYSEGGGKSCQILRNFGKDNTRTKTNRDR